MAFYSRIGNFTAVAWCSLGLGILGFFLIITGAILTGIAFTEITPPDYDENYRRYLGSSIMRIIGPLLMACGGMLLFGSCCFFAFAFYSVNADEEDEDEYEDEKSVPMSQTGQYTVNSAEYDDDQGAQYARIRREVP